MNTNIIKGFALFLLGAGIGAFVADRLLKDKYEQILQEDIESIRHAFAKDALEMGVITKLDYQELTGDRRGLVEDYTSPADLLGEKKTSIIYRDDFTKKEVAYNKLFGIDLAESADFTNPGFKRNPVEVCDDEGNLIDPEDPQPPHLITVEEFAEERDDFHKITLYYYDEDEVLTTDHDTVLYNAAELLGDEALLYFGEGTNGPDSILIRNETLGTDYEVLKISKSYKEVVLNARPAAVVTGRRRRRHNDE